MLTLEILESNARSMWSVTAKCGSKRRSGVAHRLWMNGNTVHLWAGEQKQKHTTHTPSAAAKKISRGLGCFIHKKQNKGYIANHATLHNMPVYVVVDATLSTRSISLRK